jgi:hypothetical protein
MPPQRTATSAERLESALDKVHSGVSIRAAAREFRVTYGTLQRHARGGRSQRESQEDKQLLSPSEESELVDWVRSHQEYGYPADYSSIRAMASTIAAKPIGKNWASKFLSRHVDLQHVRAMALERDRALVTPEEIMAFFKIYGDFVDRYRISEANIWNMDEMGLHVGEASRIKRVVVSHGSDRSFTTPSGATKWVTVIEAVNYLGQTATPLFITSGEVFTRSILPNRETTLQMDYKLARSKRGWTSNAIGLEWLRKCFLPSTKPEKSSQNGSQPWRLLLLDNHGSHMTPDFCDLAYQNRVMLAFFPAHATHLLQPLDVVIFGRIKQLFRQDLYERMSNGLTYISMQVFFEVYCKARQDGLTPRICSSGFTRGGILPIDPSRSISRLPSVPRPPQENEEQLPSPPQFEDMTPRTMAGMAMQHHRAGETRELGKVLNKMTADLEALEARLITQDSLLNRTKNQLLDATREPPNTEFEFEFELFYVRGGHVKCPAT